MTLKMTIPELQDFLIEDFAQVADDFVIRTLVPGEISVEMMVQDRHLRPGGTVSGPSMFALADCSVYLLILSMIGKQSLSVTTNCSIDFMRKPNANANIIARCKILKLGKSLAVGDVLIYSKGLDAPVARANLTYSIPRITVDPTS